MFPNGAFRNFYFKVSPSILVLRLKPNGLCYRKNEKRIGKHRLESSILVLIKLVREENSKCRNNKNQINILINYHIKTLLLLLIFPIIQSKRYFECHLKH